MTTVSYVRVASVPANETSVAIAASVASIAGVASVGR